MTWGVPVVLLPVVLAMTWKLPGWRLAVRVVLTRPLASLVPLVWLKRPLAPVSPC